MHASLREEILAIIDTNILLHYLWPEDWNWPSELEPIQLVFVPLIFRELEKRQYHDNSERLRERARKALKRLTDLFDSENNIKLRNGIGVRPIATEPMINFSEHSLTLEIADDYLIAHLIELRNAGQNPALLSADGPASFKARQRGFRVIRPDPKWLLPQELSKDERELQQLRAEKNAQPKLSLTITGAKKVDSVIFRWQLLNQWSPQDITRLIRKITHSLPGIRADKKLTQLDIEYLGRNESTITKWTNYIEDLDRYRRRVMLELPLALWNSGMRSAENIHLLISLSLNATLTDKRPEIPKSPEEPEESIHTRIARSVIPLSTQLSQATGKRPLLESISSTAGICSAEISVAMARQEYATDLVTLYLLFEEVDLANNFSLDWEIRALNIGAPVRGQLNVKIIKVPPVSLNTGEEKLAPIPQRPELASE